MDLDLDRIVGGIFRRLQRPLDRYYAARHPGAVGRAVIRAMSPVVRRMVPNDKWSLGVHAPFWMRAAMEPVSHPLPPSQRIFQFCAYRGQFTLELALAALLAWRGHQVTIGYLPRLGSPIKPPLTDHPSARPYLASALAQVEAASGGRVRVIDLTSYSDPQAPIDWQFIDDQTRSDTMMRCGRESLSEEEPEVAEALAYYRDLGARTQQIARSFFAAHPGEFDLALIANGMTFESAHMAHMAHEAGIELITHEKFAFRNVRIVTHGDTIFTFRDLALIWARRRELGFESEPFRSMAIRNSQELLDERRRASVRNWAWKYQFAPEQTDEACLTAVGLKLGDPYVLVCTNVPYDAGFLRLTTIFPSMRDWLIETVRHLLEHTDLPIVVRVHPGEMLHYSGRERSVDNLKVSGLLGHPRLRVIGPEEKINTYPLMQNCRVGVVFSSTTGVEMAMLGRQVVVGSKIYYADQGFTCDSVDRDGYFATLSEAAAHDIGEPLSRGIAEDAQLYYYLLHFVLQQPYPYDKGNDLRRIPPHQLVHLSDMSRYLDTLDLLATPLPEFMTVASRFHGVRTPDESGRVSELAAI